MTKAPVLGTVERQQFDSWVTRFATKFAVWCAVRKLCGGCSPAAQVVPLGEAGGAWGLFVAADTQWGSPEPVAPDWVTVPNGEGRTCTGRRSYCAGLSRLGKGLLFSYSYFSTFLCSKVCCRWLYSVYPVRH
jgi:hypothetical protein